MSTTRTPNVNGATVDALLGDGTIIHGCHVSGHGGFVSIAVVLHGSTFTVECAAETIQRVKTEGRPVRV